MLKDDLQKQRYFYEVSLLPQGVEWSCASEIIFALLNDFSGLGYARDPAELVFDFVLGLLEESVDGQEMLLELHALPAEHNGAKSRRSQPADGRDQPGEPLPSLALLPGWSVKKCRSGLAQVSLQVGQPRVIIPRSRIQSIGLRRVNKRRWKKTIRNLKKVDAVKLLDDDRLSWAGYSFSEQATVQNFAVAATTAPIGWDARQMFAELVTTPYLTFRKLRFIRFWVEAVEDSVAFLNQYTQSESLYGSHAFTFSLSGLPSPMGLAEAMAGIRSGSLTVEEAQNTFFFPKYAKRRSGSSDGA